MRSVGIDRDARAIATFTCDYPVELQPGCASDFLAAFPFQGRELVDCDPPYVQATRRGPRRYRYDFDDAAHIALLAQLQTLPCSVMISGYPSVLYDAHLPDWRTLEVQVNNQAGVVTEKVWLNFAPDRPHWHHYAGRNFTDRQRIKRKAVKWGRNYAAPPASERLAALAAMMAVEAE
ncbi:MAG: DNA adenine methylase [Aestuariivita sp.]|nr:DNA adenine methylase [Aestuariivita sp.]MCY4202405.1 DNA adenine methylase [Aestuariivita sp.]